MTGKESPMDINQVLDEYDKMFGAATPQEIDRFLDEKIEEAAAENNASALLTLLNEQIGFCRDTGQEDKALSGIKRVKELCEKTGLYGTMPYATTLMNISTAYRAFGRYDQSAECYPQIEKIYHDNLPENAFDYAGLYNNWSLLLAAQEDHEGSVNMLKKALAITDQHPDAVIQQATSRTNLAIALAGQENREEAYRYLREATERFEAAGGDDYHYTAALSAMGDLLLKDGNPEQAAKEYEKAMDLMHFYMGENPHYQSMKKKRDYAISLVQKSEPQESAIIQSERLYLEKGARMIHEKFPDYESRIAAGVCGEGSELLGYDDEISRDHDYGIGFCLWLTDEDYAKIGDALQKEYLKLIQAEEPSRLDYRRGVCTVRAYYQRILGIPLGEDYEGLTAGQWFQLQEHAIATAINGKVFRDDLGAFTRIREDLKAYYPDRIWKMRLANSAHDFAQYAQANYSRCMGRGDLVTAELCKAKGMEAAMDMAFLISRTYGPYYKWKYRALRDIPGCAKLAELLGELAITAPQADAWADYNYDARSLNTGDRIICIFEQIATILARQLSDKGLSHGEETFMEYHSKIIADEVEQTAGTSNLIKDIISREWRMFDQVHNQGGRADCQDNRPTFERMRTAQFTPWPKQLLESYLEDLKEAEQNGRNLLTEKYGRMMESTAPEEYEKIRHFFPELSKERIAMQEETIATETAWNEEFAAAHPKYAGRGRYIHTAEDSAYATSSETYLRGELSTYSDKTAALYGEWIRSLKSSGKNLAAMTADVLVREYGYSSVEDAEAKMK